MGEVPVEKQALKKGSENLKDIIFKADSKNAIKIPKPNQVKKEAKLLKFLVLPIYQKCNINFI